MTKISALEYNARAKTLLATEQTSNAELVLLLAEMERDEVFAELGYDSIWEYLRRALGQSETMTRYRIRAARAVGHFPQVTALLREGKVCITTLSKLSSVLTEENCDAVLEE